MRQAKNSAAKRSAARFGAADVACISVLLVLTLAVYSPALFGGKVLLPADIVPLMRPWAATARERFPDFVQAQNQMHGPIFEYYSWRHYARERLRGGEVPLWNPYELGGNVLLANSQSAVLYPPNLLLYVLPLWYGINLVTALHTFLTGLFLFLLLRLLKLSPPAALTGAFVWMFCGLQIVWTEFQTPTAALCWLPAVLLGWELYAQGRGWRWAVLGSGSAVALALLAGHLQFAFYVILAFVLYAIWRILTDDGRRATDNRLLSLADRSSDSVVRRPSSVAVLACSIALGITLSLATMLPVMEMGRMNFRAGKTEYEQAIGLRLPSKNLLTLLQPNLYGNPRDYVEVTPRGERRSGHPYFGAFDFIEYCCYLGIPALILAGIGAWQSGIQAFRLSEPRNPTGLFFFLLAILGLLLALGTPACAILFYAVPGYRQFNATARALSLFSFGAAAMAAYGVEVAYKVDRQRKHSLVNSAAAVALVVLALGLAAFPGMGLFEQARNDAGQMVSRLFTDQWFDYELANLRHLAIFFGATVVCLWLVLRNPQSATRNPQSATRNPQSVAWLLPALSVADLLVWGSAFNPRTDPVMLGGPTETTTYLANHEPDRVVSLEYPPAGIKSFIVPNYNAVVHLRDVQGADSLHTKRYHETLEAVVKAMEPGRSAAFTDPNTLHVPAVNHRFFDLLNVRFVTTDPQIPLGHPFLRAQVAELAIWENPGAFGPAWVAGDKCVSVHGLPEAMGFLNDPRFDLRANAFVETKPSFRFTPGNGSARVTRFAPQEISYAVTSTGDCLLVTSEVFFPGWRARVDGREGALVRADWILRATPIQAGSHRVTFRFEPASYRVGLYVSALATAAFFGIVTFRRPAIRPT